MLAVSLLFALQVYAKTFDPFPFSPGFDVESVAAVAKSLPSHSWEYGTASEALLELYNPNLSVFGSSPFPFSPKVDTTTVPALLYAKSNIVIGTPPNGLSDGDGATGDPASLGVSALMLGADDPTYLDAATAEVEYLINSAPRFSNGAISQRADVAELWADFMYMAPPFLAYYAATTKNLSLLSATVEQCELYRQILHAPDGDGLWMHIIGPQSQDTGLWSTGNAWAAAGMTRVLATVIKVPLAPAARVWRREAISKLTRYILEIVDGAINSPVDPENGLLRNYLNDTAGDGHGYGETSGSSLLAAVVYRLAVLTPSSIARSHIRWADKIRTILGDGHVSPEGIVSPAVNPLNWGDTTPYTEGSPEGENFVILMYAAWRDCVLARICKRK